jgi:DNA sulfur modification protein DndB
MIENIFDAEDLRSLARRKSHDHEFRTVRNQEVAEHVSEGWEIQRQNKTSTRLSRLKRREDLLEDRVWWMLYGMGFTHLSGEGGAFLHLDHKRDDGPTNQIDVVGLDAEIAIAVECKSASAPRRDAKFQEFLAKHGVIRERFANAVNNHFPADHKRVTVLAIFTWDLLLSENDQERAKEQKVALLNENDLHYYEQLVSHLGPAAKYQFFADMLPGKQIHGLRLAVPALETKMGRHTCYSFSITPEYLLKIAYVSHRAKGKARDVDTYQRMIKKSRLKRIRDYISENGVFPTNIVVSLEGRKSVRFEKGEQEGGPEGARYGTLHLNPAYRSAWIIDGQHRLFAYSGHERAQTSHLSVLAFQNLPASQQAQLFIDINHEQKSVKRSLLQELYAELNWVWLL